MMKTLVYTCALAVALSLSAPAEAACFVDYKAKKTKPLKLHYGVIKVPNKICDKKKKIRKNVSRRISVGGWTLLNVMSVFGPEGLEQRRKSAGRFYLKY